MASAIKRVTAPDATYMEQAKFMFDLIKRAMASQPNEDGALDRGDLAFVSHHNTDWFSLPVFDLIFVRCSFNMA